MKKMKEKSTLGGINWQQARQRLGRAGLASENALDLSPEKAQQILEERARLLARVPTPAAPPGEMLDLLTFTLANELYAVEVPYVREVIRFLEFTPVPGTENFLVGVLNLRGQILAVVDLRKTFQLADRDPGQHSQVIVLGRDSLLQPDFGLLVDGTHEVVSIQQDDILEAPASVAGIGREYLRGVTKDALIVLDGGVLLEDERLTIDETDQVGG